MNRAFTFVLSIVIIPLLMGIVSCNDLKKEVDLIIFNAKIYTPDTSASDISCIAVNDGKIFKIGSDGEIRSRFWAKESINAQKKFVYPGFNDAHSHFMGFALSLRFADLSQAGSFDEVLEIIKGYHNQHPDSWIVGRGWDQNNWPDKKFPDNDLLNRMFPDIPVVLTRIDGHAVLASDAAIKAAGIKFPVTNGEAITRNNTFTGIFLEGTADKIKNAIPKLSENEIIEYLIIANRLCNEAGLTAVTDAGLDKSDILLIDSLQKAGKLTLRMDAWLSPTQENFDYFLKDSVYLTPFLRVGAIKMYADGALGSRGACLLHPYSDDFPNKGITVTTTEQLEMVCQKAYDHGFQVNTHAIGDSAVRLVLRTYEKFLKPENDRRWRIEHAQVVNENDFSYFKNYRIIPSIQATHATSDMDWAELRLGPQRVKNAYAYNKLLSQNGWLPNGTDFPIESISPIKTFYASVARKDASGKPAEGFLIENALSRTDALKSMTIWAAKASFSENYNGSIEVGKQADFVILNTDLLTIAEDKILSSKVLYTIVDGKIVYKAK